MKNICRRLDKYQFEKHFYLQYQNRKLKHRFAIQIQKFPKAAMCFSQIKPNEYSFKRPHIHHLYEVTNHWDNETISKFQSKLRIALCSHGIRTFCWFLHKHDLYRVTNNVFVIYVGKDFASFSRSKTWFFTYQLYHIVGLIVFQEIYQLRLKHFELMSLYFCRLQLINR